ncbi:MAG: rRNA pseudouridine synthase [Treponema sp.]|nr:rRNA pseudouridine synthase [Treponema sp.]
MNKIIKQILIGSPKNFESKKTISSVLVNFGFCSVRAAKNFCLRNEVVVNGKKISDKKSLVSKSDEIFVNKEKIIIPDDVFVLIDKPLGFVTSRVSDRHRTVYELVPEQVTDYCNHTRGLTPLHAVGRLDADTTGLLILTTDGFFSHYMTDPKNEIPKEYLVTLRTPVESPEQAEYKSMCERGIILPAEKKAPEEKSGPAKLSFISQTKCKITVTEGKFHEVRRIFGALGNEVSELRRTKLWEFSLIP